LRKREESHGGEDDEVAAMAAAARLQEVSGQVDCAEAPGL